MHNKFLRESRRGFTLNELLVVIAIIGILSGIVIASLNPARESGKNAKIASDIGQYVMAIHLVKERDGQYPNPGNIYQHCLGRVNINNSCNGSVLENNNINTAIETVMGELPRAKDKISSAYWGYVYECTHRTGNNKCTNYKLTWALYGENQDCSPGVVSLSSNKITLCKYEK